MDYKLKLQQLVDYPRCRIYRQFTKRLSEDASIRLNGDSLLFYFMMLCSFVNFQTSYFRIDGSTFTISPGEWIISLDEVGKHFRKKTNKAIIEILNKLHEQKYIDYSILNSKRIVKYRINNWSKFNTIIEANAPCTKELGFFFFPFKYLDRFLGHSKCSEMDIVLDLWLNTVYNDSRISGSDVGPVVYYRNGTGSPLIGYEELGKRWGVSKSTAGRILKKLEENGYIKIVSFQGRYGSAIYLCDYLSTMFNISDVLIDKEEVAMSLNIKVKIPEKELEEEINPETLFETQDNGGESACQNSENLLSDDQFSVSDSDISVPKPHLLKMVKKALKVLYSQGIPCASCTRARYLLYPLSDDCKGHDMSLGNILLLRFIIRCPDIENEYRFNLTVEKCDESEGA